MRSIRTIFVWGLFAFGVCAAADDGAPSVVATIDGIPAAEFAMQTRQGRLFAASDGAIYELSENFGSWTKSEIPALFNDGSTHACYYLGLAEYADTLYSICTVDFYDVHAAKYLMALDLAPGAVQQLHEVGELSAAGSPNGLAVDGTGHLYYADFGIFYAGSVHRITLAGDSVAEDVSVLQYSDINPNGLAIDRDRLYVGGDPILEIGVSRLMRYRLVGGRPVDSKVIYQAFATFDDLSLADDGQILLPEFLWGSLVDVDERSGKLLRSLPVSTPTNAQIIHPAGHSAGDSLLMVTQRGNNSVLLMTNPWGLKPRN